MKKVTAKQENTTVYFPLPIPVIEPNVPVSQQGNAGRSDQYI